MKKVDVRKSIIFLAVSVAVVSIFVIGQIAKADAWFWSSGLPTVESSNNVSTGSQWQDSCASQFKTHPEVVDINNSLFYAGQTDCLIGEGKNYKLFTFSSKEMAIQFKGDVRASVISGMRCNFSCLYLPSKDILIKVDSQLYNGAGRIGIYKNFVSKLRLENTTTLNQRFYSFNQQQPDQTISNFYGETGSFGYFKEMQRSNNDKWLVGDVIDLGLVRIDMDTMQMLKFSDSRTSYGYGSPSLEFDVTNDGQRIAIFGERSIKTIVDVVPGCGNALPINTSQEELDKMQKVTCPSTQQLNGDSNNTFIPNVRDLYQPQFNDDGGKISFYATSYDSSQQAKKVTLKAANYTGPQPLDYLALGDSYSSGEGDIDPYGVNYYRPFTDVKGDKDKGVAQEKCHISTRSYPYKLAASMSLSINGTKKWDTVTCSGARIKDVESKDPSNYLGQYDRLRGYNFEVLKTQALNEFIPGRQQQIEFVKKYKPSVITLTIGGNDVNFIDKLKPCAFSIDTCSYANTRKADLASDISSRYDNLRSLYKELFVASGKKSKIYVLGYPGFINGSSAALCGVNIGLLNLNEREMIQNSITYLNNVIKKATESAGVKYINVENSLVGHRLCDVGEKYMNGAAFGLSIDGLSDFGSFHPNAKGHQSIASNVSSEQNLKGVNLLNYNICPNEQENICPDLNISKEDIEIPPYFKDVVNNKNTHYEELTKFEQTVNTFIDVSVGAYTFATNTVVTSLGYSEPVILGTITASSDGSVKGRLLIPSSMSVGFHTIVLTGKSYSGDPIEYEQVVLLKGPRSYDVDADGVLDSEDKCLFVQSKNEDYDVDGIDDACDVMIGDKPAAPSPISTSPIPSPAPKPSPTSSSTVANIINQILNLLALLVYILTNIFKKIFLSLW